MDNEHTEWKINIKASIYFFLAIVIKKTSSCINDAGGHKGADNWKIMGCIFLLLVFPLLGHTHVMVNVDTIFMNFKPCPCSHVPVPSNHVCRLHTYSWTLDNVASRQFEGVQKMSFMKQ